MNPTEADNARTLMQLLHSRLNHLQLLLSALYGLVFTASGGVAALLLVYWKERDIEQVRAVIFVVWVALGWASLFAIYQICASVRCVLSIRPLEKLLAPKGYKEDYFDCAWPRLLAYGVVHAFPVMAFIFSPKVLQRLVPEDFGPSYWSDRMWTGIGVSLAWSLLCFSGMWWSTVRSFVGKLRRILGIRPPQATE